MISRSTIKKLTSSSSYSKGIDVYGYGRVRNLEVEEDPIGNEIVTAKVKGSKNSFYDVYMELEPDEERILEVDCDCPAFSSYAGICKHCVAVLFEYNDYCRTRIQSKLSQYLTSPGNRVKKNEVLYSTPSLRALLQKKTDDRTLPLLQKDIFGKVHLEPYMECMQNGTSLEFKIGITQLYVIKDIFEFIRNVNNHIDYTYGKKLSFNHSLVAFDRESQPLVSFLISWTENNKDRYIPTSYYGYFTSSLPKSRYAKLDGNYMTQFLDIMAGRRIKASVISQKNTEWVISDEPYARELAIKGQEKGIEIFVERTTGYFLDSEYVEFDNGIIHRFPYEKIQPVKDFMIMMREQSDGRAYLDEKDVPAFCTSLLPALKKFYKVKTADFDETSYVIMTPLFKFYLDAPQENMISCKPVVEYGDTEYSLYDTKDLSNRNIEEEAAVREIVLSYGNAYDENTKSMTAIDDDETLYELLINGIPAFQTIGEVYVSDKIKKMEVRQAPKVTVGVSISGNLLELTVDTDDMPMEELLDILSRYSDKKKFYRLKNGSFINTENSGLEALLDLKNGLGLSDKQLRQDTISLEKYRALYIDAELKDNPVLASAKKESFRSLIRNMKTIEDNDFEIPESLNKILREYQRNGFLWIKTLKENGFGGILADDMGLGKTLQVICFLLSEYENSTIKNEKTLIVSPASLVFNWKEEFTKFAPILPVTMVIGDARERKTIIENAQENEILITSYDLLKRDIDNYTAMHFSNEIIDEAQFIKNHGTQAAQAVKEIESDFRLALTGTPVENRLSELWSIFDYLMPGFLYSYKKFKEKIEIPIIQEEDEKSIHRLQCMIRPFVLRRLKKDVLKDLPDKLEENMYVKLSGEQQEIYSAHVQKMKILLNKQTDTEFKNSKLVILSELMKLRQICCDPALIYEDYKGESAKMDMCLNLIVNAVANGHKILLFSQFTTMLDRLADALTNEKISYFMLTGATSKEKRAQMVADFNRDDTAVFCISLKAGGTGLNLTAADMVIHFDPWWNLAVQNQATDRAHRIGQKNVVNVYKLVAKNTIEENIINLQEKKKELANQILSGEGVSVGNLTKEELLGLID